MTEPLGTVTTRDRHGLLGVDPERIIEACTFRILETSEIRRGMAYIPAVSPQPSPGRARMPGIRLLLGAAAALLLFVLLLIAVFVDTRMVRTEVLRTETRSATVEYDGAAYYAGLLRRESLLLHRRLPDAIVVGRDPGMGYGHPVYFEILGNRDPELASARWSPEGVAIRLDSGHEIFVPADAFTGGR
ncbi:hypothetical protein AB0H60_17675 [Nocardia rhamnosiphila]|uniref:hypothetical protein n=1 Tax=Nocardia rhamnosiphila TaxID=426716 RepID=UPI0033EB80A3